LTISSSGGILQKIQLTRRTRVRSVFRHGMSRGIGVAWIVLAFSLGVLTATTAVLAVQPSPWTPARSGEPTYLVEARISSSHGSVEGAKATVGVTLTSTWVGSDYPGESMCTLSLTDADGSLVGQQEFGFSAMTSPAVFPESPVPVDGEPVDASVICSRAVLESDGGSYRFEDAVFEFDEDRGIFVVRSTARWATSDSPGIHRCVVTTAGSNQAADFTLGVKDGNTFSAPVPEAMATQGTDPMFNCELFVG
jgi:hypothetical protein